MFYYTSKYNKKGGTREKNTNKTPEAQKKINSRNSARKLTRILNANFDGSSWYITLSYKKNLRPTDKKAFKCDVDKFLRNLRALYKREGKVLKYVWVPEMGERGAVHIHIVINNIEALKVKNLWNKGWITLKPLDNDGQYRRLANYFIKYSDKAMKTEESISSRRYNASKNLIIPEPEKKVVMGRNAYNHTICVPEGWCIDKDSIVEAWHEVTGYMFFTYTLIYIGKTNIVFDRIFSMGMETGEIEIKERHIKQKGRNKHAKLQNKSNENTDRKGDVVRSGRR